MSSSQTSRKMPDYSLPKNLYEAQKMEEDKAMSENTEAINKAAKKLRNRMNKVSHMRNADYRETALEVIRAYNSELRKNK